MWTGQLLTLGLLASFVHCHLASVRDRGCVSSFHTNPNKFEVCKKKLCFIMLVEQPFVYPDPSLLSLPSHPFLCREHDTKYPKLQGVFFEVLRGVSEQVPEVRDAMCVYSGSKCKFDDSVRFVEEAVKSNSKYRFLAGGYLLFLSHRRTLHTVQSHPWSSDSMVAILRPDDARPSFPLVWKQVFQPFSIQGWMLLTGFVLLFFLCVVIHVLRFSPTMKFRPLVRWFIMAKPTERGVWETASWNALKFSMIVFCTVLVLLYEISVVGFILQGPELTVSDIGSLKSFGLKNFALVKGDATEAVFRHEVGWGKKKGKVPWVQVDTLDDVISMIDNRTVRYGFSIETTVANVLQRKKLCDVISAVPTKKRDAGGWIYGTEIPFELRTRIDQALSNLVFKLLPSKSRRKFGLSPLRCGEVTGKVDHKVLFVLLLLTVVPFILKYVVAVVLSYCSRDMEYYGIETSSSATLTCISNQSSQGSTLEKYK